MAMKILRATQLTLVLVDIMYSTTNQHKILQWSDPNGKARHAVEGSETYERERQSIRQEDVCKFMYHADKITGRIQLTFSTVD